MIFDKVSLVTGGFDPIHSGHLRYFERAKDFSDYLIVGLNGDPWLKRKKGQYFLSWTERADIIRHLDMVDAVISWDDTDDTAKGAIRKCLEISKQVVFCNGGDRGHSNTPETMGFANNENVIFEYGVGGEDKMNSSSWILHGYFERAKDFSDYLIVGLNGDPWLKRKKGQYFLSWTERADIIRHLDMVDAVISWDDSDDTAKGAIRKCLEISKQVVFLSLIHI